MANRLIPYNKNLKAKANVLRNNSTLGEILLWQKIKARALGVEFHRQVPINEFIVDFYCHELMLAIEVDGNSHDEDKAQRYDIERLKILESLGVRFIRFADWEVKQEMNGVVEALRNKIDLYASRNEITDKHIAFDCLYK